MKKSIFYLIIFSFSMIGCKKEENPIWHYNEFTHWKILKEEKVDEANHIFISENGKKVCTVCTYQTSFTDEENYQVFLNLKKTMSIYQGDYTYQHFYQSDEYQEEVLEMYSSTGLFYRSEVLLEPANEKWIEVSENIDALIMKNDAYLYLKTTRFLNHQHQWIEQKKEEKVDFLFSYSLKEYSPSSLLNSSEVQVIQGQNYEEYTKNLKKDETNQNLLSFTPFTYREKNNTIRLGYKKREKSFKNVLESFVLNFNEERILQTFYQSHYIEDAVVALGPIFSLISSMDYQFNFKDYYQRIQSFS